MTSPSVDGASPAPRDALWARDLPRIRDLGANAIRVYRMISRQLNTNGTLPAPGTGQLFTHKLYSPLAPFFDKTWRPGEIQPVN